MILRQTLEKPVDGFWDGGKKQQFDWTIQGSPSIDSKGKFVKIGSFGANLWFCVALGKTDKLTLVNAKRRLKTMTGMASDFRYVNS